MEFYTHEKVTKHITRIRAFWNDACMYYIEGESAGLLIDTGYGYGDLRSYVDSIATKPYEVALSHGHLDHANGAGQWKDVWMNPKDLNLYHTSMRRDVVYPFLKNYIPDLDERDQSLWQKPHDDSFLDLEDGKVFDLGCLHVQVIAAPGHTRGMLVFLVKEDRTILFGDACGVFTLFLREESTTLEEYQSTLAVLKSHEDEYDRILRQHGTCESPKSLLDEDITIVKSILAGTDDHQSFTFNGTPCYLARRIDPVTKQRIDGKEGNIVYTNEKVRVSK